MKDNLSKSEQRRLLLSAKKKLQKVYLQDKYKSGLKLTEMAKIETIINRCMNKLK